MLSQTDNIPDNTSRRRNNDGEYQRVTPAVTVDADNAALSETAAQQSETSDRESRLEESLFNREWRLRLNLNISPYTIILVGILILALFLRMTGTDWDQEGLFHPDERDFLGRAEKLDFAELSNPSRLFTVESRLNPGWFNYGSLPLYALAGVKAVASPFTELNWNLFDLRYHGRNLAAVSDAITILLIFLLARRLFDIRAALTAAALAALAVIHIQNAHYTAVDVPMTMFITATVYFSVRFVQEGRMRDSILAGAMLGFAIASKLSAAPVALAIATAHILYLAAPILQGAQTKSISSENFDFAIRSIIASGATAMITLVISQPYMIIDWATYVANATEQSEMVRRIRDYPFTRQYIDTTAYWYQMRQLSTWGLGISLGILVWIALAWAIGRSLICRDKSIIVILSFLVPYLLLTGWFEVKFLRYMLPSVPLLIVFSGGFIWWTYDKILPRLHIAVKYLAYIIAGVGLLLLIHYAFAYINVFRGEHPAQQVSQWLRDNAEPGSVVIQEHWEEGIPNVPELRMHDRLPMYENDNLFKYSTVTELMAGADYLILYSNRLSATIPRLPERYPIGTRFYEMLFNGELGYQYAYSAERVPQLFGILYWDDPYARVNFSEPPGYTYPQGALFNWNWYGWADESHTVYEHPHVIVFENTGRLSPEQLLTTLRVDEFITESDPFVSRELGLTLSETDLQTQRSGGTWESVYYLSDLSNQISWLWWLAIIQAIGLATVPLSYVIFRPLPDRGYLFSKPLGILLVATAAWLLASYGLIGFSVISVALSIAALVLISILILWRIRDEIAAYFKTHWRTIAIAELIFLIAFFAFLAVRIANPDLWHAWRGGEKPMDFAYLNAITRSTVMPPYDPWFAGGYLNYYYFGQFIVATIIRVAGIAPGVAYNLAVPTIFALTASAAYAVAYNLVAMVIKSKGATRLGPSPVVFGLLAALFVVVAGNIDGLMQVIEGMRRALVQEQPFGQFDYWRSSRMLEPGTGGNEITEFPYFTFLYADLHAHMIALPFAILGLGLAISTFLRAGLRRISKLETFAALAILGIVVGSLRLINSWDYPTQLLMASGFILIGEILFGQQGATRRFINAIGKIIVVAIIGYIVYLPFHSNFELFNSGIERSLYQTPLWRYFAIHSIFLLAIFSWIFWEWRRGSFGFNRVFKRFIKPDQYSLSGALFIAFGSGVVWISIFFLFPSYVTVFATLTGATVLLATAVMAFAASHSTHRYVVITTMVAALALILAAGVDAVTVKNDIGRQNTIFKFYIQAWWMLSIVASFAIWRLWQYGAFSLRNMGVRHQIWATLFAVLAVGIMIFPVLSTRVKMAERFNINGAGIDGEAYMDDAVYRRDGIELSLGLDRHGINWLRSNVKGSPVIVEGVWDLYTWTQRVSIYTGLPTVIGWDWHQRQQRHEYSWAVHQRRDDVQTFYSSTDMNEAIDFLDRYDVRYVYVGEMERGIYPDDGIAKFDDMEDMGLRAVFQSGPVTIYEYTG